MSKVYLSLDDLHKLYGISPAVVSAIKKKRRKRRAKKINKINNGTMGATKASSAHMVGSSSAIALDNIALNKAKIDKHIKDINDENKAIQLKLNTPPIQVAPPPQPQQNQNMFQLLNDINNGTIKATHTHNKLTLTDSRLNHKPGPQLGSKRYDTDKPYMTPVKKTKAKVNKTDNTGIQSATNSLNSSQFHLEPSGGGGLSSGGGPSSGGSSTIIRKEEKAIDFDDGMGNVGSSSLSSDAFAQVSDTGDASQPAVIPTQDEIDAKAAQDAQDAQDALDEQAAADEQAVLDQQAADEQDALDQQAAAAAAYVPKPIGDYTVKVLNSIAQFNLIPTKVSGKNLYTKEPLYKLLLDKKLV